MKFFVTIMILCCALAFTMNAFGKAHKKTVVQKLDCGVHYVLGFAILAKRNQISSYECDVFSGPKKIPVKFEGSEIFLAPNAPKGTQFTFQIMTRNTDTIAAMLHGSFPSIVKRSVSALSKNGTCARVGMTVVSGGISGEDYVVLDQQMDKNKRLQVRFVCQN